MGRIDSWLQHAGAWIRHAWTGLALEYLGLLIVAVAAAQRHRAAILVGGVVVAVAADHLTIKSRTYDGSSLGRLFVLAVQAVVAAVFWFGGHASGGDADGLFFTSLMLMLLTGSAFWSILRTIGEPLRTRLAAGLASSTVVVFGGLLASSDLWSWGPIALVALLAAVAGELAGELASARLARLSGDRRWFFIGAGVVVLAVGLAWLALAGVEAGPLLIIALAAAAVAGLVAIDNDAVVLVLLLPAAFTWATAPDAVDVPPPAQVEPGDDYFVAFGDSYISGEGGTRFFSDTNETERNADATNGCRRSDQAWPVRLAGGPPAGVPDKVLVVTCSGAVTENIDRVPFVKQGHEFRSGPAEIELYERARAALDRDPEFVVLSIGGNDAGFGNIGKTCLAPGDCAELGQLYLDDGQPQGPLDNQGAEDLVNIVDDLEMAYDRLASAFPDTPVLVVGYPVPVLTERSCREILLDQNERIFIDGFVRQLNGVVKSVAESRNFTFVPATQEVLVDNDATLCDDGPLRAMNFIGFHPSAGPVRDALNPANWIHNSFHPTDEGHALLYKAIRSWIEENGLPEGRADQADTPVVSVASLDEIFEPHGVEPPACARSCSITGGKWVVGQIQDLYRQGIVPFGLVLVGAWLVVGGVLWDVATARLTSVADRLAALARSLRRRGRGRGRPPGPAAGG